MSQREESGTKSVLWWLGWMFISIASFFLCAWLWTPIIADKMGSMREANTQVVWVAAVFGSWMIVLIPLIIIMYNKVDRSYDEARTKRESRAAKLAEMQHNFRTISVPQEKRMLSDDLAKRIHKMKRTIQTGHLLNLHLTNGQTIDYAFVTRANEIVGLYDKNEMNFEGKDVVEVSPIPEDASLDFEAERWLRLDGTK